MSQTQQSTQNAPGPGLPDEPVVLVTGGRGGIGTAIVSALSGAGARLMINDLDAASGASDDRTGFVAADISTVAGAQSAVAATVERYGRIDALVNNAGIGVLAPTTEITESDWDRVFSTNLKGPFFATQAAARHMLEQGGGRIVNVASQLAHTGHPSIATYAASKAALLNLTRSLAQDLAPSIQVNAVCPGPTDTAMLRGGPDDLGDLAAAMPVGRVLTPEEVALSVLFLLGPGGAPYTGQHLDPNGGIVMA